MNILPKRITSQKELDSFLSSKNAYTEFISKKLQTVFLAGTKTQWHHILPKYAQGTDHTFNLIELSYADHIIAHELLYQVYGHEEDLLAVRFMTNNPQAHIARIKLSHQASKLNQTGFYSSKNQSVQGQKGGKIRSLEKDKKFAEKQHPLVNELLAVNHTWFNTKAKLTIHIKGGDFLLTRDLIDFLIKSFPEETVQKSTCKKGYLPGMFSKVMKGERKSALGWEVKKI